MFKAAQNALPSFKRAVCANCGCKLSYTHRYVNNHRSRDRHWHHLEKGKYGDWGKHKVCDRHKCENPVPR